ncbi:MAG: hypothetical protein ACKV2T_38865, partial [Kofleriaceae bacterium]
MKRTLFAVVLALVSCKSRTEPKKAPEPDQGSAMKDPKKPEPPKDTPMSADHPLLAPYTGAHGGGPAFDKIKTADFKPALLKGMELARAEIAAITD